MSDLTRPEIARPLLLGALVVLAASLSLWVSVIRRLRRREPVLVYEPRRPVPWQGIDLLLVVVFCVVAAGSVAELDRYLFPADSSPEPRRGARPTVEHRVVVLLREERSLATLGWCVAAAVLVAPVVEEVFFRLLLQGWLEVLERRWRREIRFSRGILRGVLPVLYSSLLFALLHSRESGPAPSPRTILHMVVCGMIVNLAALVFALALVRHHAGATRADLGFAAGKFWEDVRLGLVVALLVVPWIYVVQLVVMEVLPPNVAPDAFTLLPFAAALGTLYYRTHRIVPSIVLHMTLNASSLALAWLLPGSGGL